MPKKINKIIIAIVLLGVAYFAYQRFMPHGGGNQPVAMMGGGAAPVSVAEVIVRNIQQWNEFSGKLVAVDKVEIRPRISGVIESIGFTNGAMVSKGDLLFTIDARPYQADVSRAEAAFASAEAQEKLAQSEYERAQRLYKEKAIPQREYDERKNAANVATANLKSAQASLEFARLNLEYTQVTAPISGKVSRAEITIGNLVEAGPTAPILTTIVSNNPIYVDFEVDEDTFLQYSKNKAVGDDENQNIPVIMEVSTEKYSGRVESFDNSLNVTSGTIRARAVFDNHYGNLVPGLFARVKLGSAEEIETTLITDRAVGTDQNKKFVFVVGADNNAAYREVKLGPIADGLRVVREGLKPGEKIVVNGLQRVRPGAPITPELVAMDASESVQKIEPAGNEVKVKEK